MSSGSGVIKEAFLAPSSSAHGCEVSRLRISNLCCIGEERLIRATLKSLRGIEDVKVNIIGRYAVIKHCPKDCCSPPFLIIERLNNVKLGASIQEVGGGPSTDADSDPDEKPNFEKLLLTLLSIILFILGVAFNTSSDITNQHVSIAMYVICIIIGGSPIALNVYVAYLRRLIDINVLIFVAVCGAVSILEFTDASLVVTLFSVSECIESEVMRWVRKTVKVSRGSIPSNALLPSGLSVPLQTLSIGDIVVFRAGDMISVDGKVVKGSAVVDESAMTGEAIPRSKDIIDSQVLSGTIVQNGYIEVKLEKSPENSSIQKLNELIADAQAERDEMSSLIDQFAEYWTPLVILTAVLMFLLLGVLTGQWRDFLLRALSLLVLACPCCILLAAPIPCVVAMASAASHGVLIKGSAVIEKMSEIKVVATDKTGTLTRGFFKVVDKVHINDSKLNDTSVNSMQLAASLESKSAHPLAGAVVADFIPCLAEQGDLLLPVQNLVNTPGIGLEGWVAKDKDEDDWVHVAVGNNKLFRENGGKCDVSLQTMAVVNKFLSKNENTGASILFVAIDDRLRLILAMEDTLRPESVDLVAELKNIGIHRIMMLTGDQQETALYIAAKVGISTQDVRSRLTPSEKLDFIKTHFKHKLLMIGDGINDAAALAGASVGVAMGSGCAAMACCSAGVVISSENIMLLATCIKLCRFVRRLIYGNIAFAVVIKIIAIVLAISGLLPLWAAILIDTSSLIIVIANSMVPAFQAKSIWKVNDKNTTVEVVVEGNSHSDETAVFLNSYAPVT